MLPVIAIVFGVIGIRRVSKGQAGNQGMAITGLIAGVIALGLAIAGLVGTVPGLNRLSHEPGRRPRQVKRAAAAEPEHSGTAAAALA